MIMDFLVDLSCVLFLLLTAMYCFSWVWLRNALIWKGKRRWIPVVFKVVALLLGAWHLLFGVLKLVYLIMWTVTT